MTSFTHQKSGLHRQLFLQLLHTYFIMKRGLTLGVRAVVRSEDGKFLLVRHTYTPGWHFPGGGVEKGETAERTLTNELLQETGLRLTTKPTLHGAYHNSGISKRDHVLVYLCEVDGTLPDTPPSMEISEIGYFSFANLPDGVEPGTLRRMKELVEGVAQSGAW
ncbi:NUDIX domain-containing protein [Notoacmeibacter sp. MSK16QG-6]|uniref:NUDIX domain-containing protein n=1 Tax=Notoacmeibacter sp. MSK16QG-6 TaxID=2957982 RepID=UPI00209D57CB|nr:NUDIX domain-containing protein [Notoacmeibacter sp. MSK16QG-6]MCP1198072.1 NUDIX domain-containing protein [Notoacmeibacter sp. MSK16QG-6]